MFNLYEKKETSFLMNFYFHHLAAAAYHSDWLGVKFNDVHRISCILTCTVIGLDWHWPCIFHRLHAIKLYVVVLWLTSINVWNVRYKFRDCNPWIIVQSRDFRDRIEIVIPRSRDWTTCKISLNSGCQRRKSHHITFLNYELFNFTPNSKR